MSHLGAEYYRGKSTVELSRALLGAKLVCNSPEGRTSGIIVETEAYLRDDPACHASRGMTKRNRSMFLEPGRAYVYFIYGNYHCLNVVTNEEGIGEAVLIRALEPLEGMDLMAVRRGTDELYQLTSGPGRLCEAMGIDRSLDGIEMWGEELYIEGHAVQEDLSISASGRIGIKQGTEMQLRFYIEGNPFVSRCAVSRKP